MNETMKENEKIKKLREIVKNHQCEEVEGQLIDASSASVMIQVFDAIKKKENKIKFMNLPIIKMNQIAWSFVS